MVIGVLLLAIIGVAFLTSYGEDAITALDEPFTDFDEWTEDDFRAADADRDYDEESSYA